MSNIVVAKNIVSKTKFTSQKDYSRRREQKLKGPKGWLVLYSTKSGYERGQRIVNYYNANMQQEEIRNTGEYKQVNFFHHREDDEEPIVRVHSDGETNPRLPDSVDGANVILVSDPHSKLKDYSVNEDIVRTLQMAEVIKDQGASNVCLLLSYMPYSRAERATFMKKEAAMAQWLANMIAHSGVDEVLCYHLHNDAVKSFYQPHRIRMYPLGGLTFPKEVFGDFKGDKETVVLSPDSGAAKLLEYLANDLDLQLRVSGKGRDARGESRNLGISGNLNGFSKALIFDDETVTFGTLRNAIERAHNESDIREFHVCISHAKLTDKGISNLEESVKYGLKKVYFTNSIPQDFSRYPDFVEVGDLNPLFANVINRRHYTFPVSKIFKLFE